MPAASRVIEGGIQAAKGVERPLHQPLDGGGIADVSRHWQRSATGSGDLMDEHGQPLFVSCGQRGTRTGRREHTASGGTDAAARTSDGRDLPDKELMMSPPRA